MRLHVAWPLHRGVTTVTLGPPLRRFMGTRRTIYVLLSETQREHFKQVLETRIAELDHAVAAAEQEAREGVVKHADTADQAASEYERQALVHKAATARQMLRNLTQALERMRQGTFGECAECGGDIDLIRLEDFPGAWFCVGCQEARERR